MPQPSDPFQGVDWEDLHKRLLVVALRLSSLMSTDDKVLAGTGLSAEDLVSATIVKALCGDEIRFRAERGQLFGLLKTAMTRDFIDLRRRRSHQRTDHLDLNSEAAERDVRLRDFNGEGRQEAAELLSDVRRLVEDDSELVEYVDAVELGCESPAEIADVCQAAVTDIYSRRRKLKARYLRLFAGKVTT